MKDKYSAARITILGVAVFLLAVGVVIHFGPQLEKISWSLVSILCIAAAIVYMLYHWNAQPDNKSTYSVQDLFMTDGKADIWKHMIIVMAGVSVWTIVQKVVTDPKGDITALLTIVLGVFVSKEILGAFAEAIKSRPPALPAGPSQDIHISAGAEIPKAVPASTLLDANAVRGVEQLSPSIKAADVGKSVALVSRKKSTRRKSK